jgi:hypothetical protein
MKIAGIRDCRNGGEVWASQDILGARFHIVSFKPVSAFPNPFAPKREPPENISPTFCGKRAEDVINPHVQ